MTNPTDLQFIQFEGCAGNKLSAYQTIGSRDYALVCLPGGPGFDISSLLPGVLGLAEHFSLTLLNPRGTATSPSVTGNKYSMSDYAADLANVGRILRKSFRSVGILGHSFGGSMALDAIKSTPGVFDFSILVAAPFNQSWLKGIPHAVEVAGLTQSAAEAERKFEGTAKSDATYSELMISYAPLYLPEIEAKVAFEMMKGWTFSVAPYLVASDSIFSEMNYTDDLATISIPTLVVAGGRDDLITSVHLRELADRLKTGTFAEISDAGHFPFLTRTERFCSLVGNWWNNQKGVLK